MCILPREAMYDEEKAIAIIDSESLEDISNSVIELSIKYQDQVEWFTSLEHPSENDLDKLDEVCQELACYRKALQVKSNFEG